VKALAPLELLLHLALRLGDARLEGLDQDWFCDSSWRSCWYIGLLAAASLGSTRPERLACSVAFALALQRVHQVLDLLLDLDDVRVVYPGSSGAACRAGLQLSDTRAVLALARDRGGRFGLAEHLPLERRAPDLGFAQLLRRALECACAARSGAS